MCLRGGRRVTRRSDWVLRGWNERPRFTQPFLVRGKMSSTGAVEGMGGVDAMCLQCLEGGESRVSSSQGTNS